MRLHLCPLGVVQHISVHPKLESQYLAWGNPKSQQTLEHYVNAGYYEGRSPGPCFVDQAWYEQYYSDLGDALRQGEIADSAEHFQHNGYFEGRVSTADQLPDREKWRVLLREETRES
jgi:hypothetical protein